MQVMKKLSLGSETLYARWAERFQRFRQCSDGLPPTLDEGEAFLSSLEADGLKPNTLGVAARALRRLYGLDLPAPSIEMLEPQYLTVDQVRQLIEAAPTLLESTIITVLFSSACRISEILELMVKDLELDKAVATVTRKGGRRERVNLGSQGSEALKEWLARRRSHSPRVFMDYTYLDIYRMLRKLGVKAGIPFHPHLLRHTRIRHLMEAGVPIERVSEIAGHRKLDTTLKIYGRLRAEELSKYLEAAPW